MKRQVKYVLAIILCIGGIFVFSCTKKEKNAEVTETILEGKTSILVDETLMPIIADQVEIFENSYNAKITLIPESEKESILSLANNKARIIILPRELNKEELKIFKAKKIQPKSTVFATDAIAFIKYKTANDTLIVLNEVVDFLNGKQSSIKGLVFDNPNSSTVNYIKNLAHIKELPENGIYSFKTNNEVIQYVSENKGMIGVVGVNWLFQPSMKMREYVDKVAVLSVKGTTNNEYVYPSQENIATRKYPLARDLYIINCQGYEGLGMGFSSFIAGEKGQRIILKSGLAPIRVPSRIIRTRKQIETNTN